MSDSKFKDYKLKKSFRVPNIDVFIHDVKNEMTTYESIQDINERVVKYMNEQHALFLDGLSITEKTAAEIIAHQGTESTLKRTYELAITPKQTISIKCTKKNCRFRIYFSGTAVGKDFTNITQRMPFYVSWHSYPLH